MTTELKAQNNITYLVESGSVNNVERIFGSIIKIGRKSYVVEFTSSYWWNGDEFTFSPKNLKFKESGVRPTKNMVLTARLEILRYKGHMSDFNLN